nr:probable oxidoreductase/Short-chain dehydrogenase [Kibdelosporangium sp. MJ126-NF4]
MDNTSRTALVTDAEDGIGHDTARRLALEGWTVVVHARTSAAGEQTVVRLVQAGAVLGRLDVVVADFASLGSVERMARKVTERHPKLDLLVNTTGSAAAERRLLTEDGNERTFQVDYLAEYLLTRLLESALANAGYPRVVNVSSSLHRGGSLQWTDINRSRRYTPLAAYSQAMLALAMFTKALADTGMTAVCVDPGTSDRDVLRLHGPDAEPNYNAVDAVVRLCAPGFDVLNGAFYEDRLPAPTGPGVQDSRAVARLWKLSERLTNVT